MSDILSEVPITYVKWDFNRSICDKFSNELGPQYQGEFAHRYVLGLYRVLEELTTKFPHILFEGCSGGGGRFDPGMLYLPPISGVAIIRIPLQGLLFSTEPLLDIRFLLWEHMFPLFPIIRPDGLHLFQPEPM